MLLRHEPLAPLALVVCLALACRAERQTPDDVAQAGSTSTSAAEQGFDAARWQPPAESDIPDDSLGASIRRGLAIFLHTPDSLPRFAPGHIACGNCHLNAGRNVDAAPLTGSHARFPKYLERAGAVIGLADRVNYCFTRSLAGTRLPVESREMQDILAYIAWLSRDVPVGVRIAGADGLPAMPKLVGDSARGRALFAGKCVSCHGVDGQGRVGIPALWGPRSYSVGASMARQSKAASFIWHNMPLGLGRTLTHQQAYDLAAFVDAQPRPDSPGKEEDWPGGGAPSDAPYATRGHAAYLPPPLLPRKNAAGAVVPRPSSVARSQR
jgi:thiosulfate dehydrogenase